MLPRLTRRQAYSTRDLVVLRILAEGPFHGAEVLAEYIRVTGNKELQETTIYTTLRRLAELGYLEKIGVRPGAPKNSSSYKLTGQGRQMLESYVKLLSLE